MSEFDTTALMAAILRDAKVPKGSSYRTASVLLGMADEQMRTLLVPELLKVPGDMLAARVVVPLEANKGTYRLPTRLLRLLECYLVNADGEPVAGFSRATPQQARAFAVGRRSTASTPRWWYMESSSVVLFPAPDATSALSLVVRYARRPSRLVETSDAWTLESFSTTTFNLTVNAGGPVPEVGQTLDFVKSTPGFEVLDSLEVLAVTPISGGRYTLSFDSLPDGLEDVDYLCPEGVAPVPQIPPDYHPVLAQAVVAQVAKEQGDSEGEARARQRIAELLVSAQPILEPRAEEAEVCVNEDWL